MHTHAVLLATLLAVAGRPGQTAGDRTGAALATAYDLVARHLVATSALMPEAGYDYRPTPETRSFGQIIAHVAGAQFLYCSQAVGQRLPAEVGARLGALRPYSDVASAAQVQRVSREELIVVLQDSVDVCKRAYAAAGAAGTANAAPLVENLAHSNEHYGNLVTYLRLNGRVPPSTAPAR